MSEPAGDVIDRLLNGTTDAGAVLDEEGRVLRLNRAFATRFQVRPRIVDSIVDARPYLKELLVSTGVIVAPSLSIQLTHLLRQPRPTHLAEVALPLADGDEYVFWISFIPIADAPKRNLLTLRDVSSEARVQVRYRRLLDAAHARADSLERAVEERTRELRAALDEVGRLASTDALTGLCNRRAFSEAALRKLSSAVRHKRSIAIAVLDLDYFKSVNDRYGHATGDSVLRAVAVALGKTVRSSDIVSRFGGEEFAILFDEVSAEDAMLAGERLRAAVEAIPIGDLAPGRTQRQTVSMGIALYPDDGESLDELLNVADRALYRAKAAGRNLVVRGSERKLPNRPNLTRARVLVAGPSEVEFPQLDGFDVLRVQKWEEAFSVCDNQRFDALVADYVASDPISLTFLEHSLGTLPGALRLLLVHSREEFLSLQGVSISAVDGFINVSDLDRHLWSSLEVGLARREVMRDAVFRRDSMFLQSSDRASVERALSNVVHSGSFRMVYQPILEAATGQPFGTKATMALEDSLQAEAVFTLARRRGQVFEIGRRIRDRVAQWLMNSPSSEPVFVRLDAAELTVQGLVEDSEPIHAFAHRVVFEIAERASLRNHQRMIACIERLRGRGYRVAIDDLGAGYASLNLIALLRPNWVKIEPGLVAGIEQSTSQARLVRYVVEFAHGEGIKVIADGVDSDDARTLLASFGVDYVQKDPNGP